MRKSQSVYPTVLHVMRTYGNHGGEQQLARMFACQPEAANEHFLFAYADLSCESLMQARGAKLQFHRLWPLALRPRYRAWSELLLLLPLLPYLQLRLGWLFIKYRPQACIIHGFQAALIAWPLAMLMRKSVGFAYFHRITKSTTGRHPFFRLIYKPYRKLIGVSLAVRDSMQGLAESSRLDAIENGVDIERIRAPQEKVRRSDSPVIISVGRLLPHKGQDLIIEAVQQCHSHFPNVELWIVGDGESYEFLKQKIAGSDYIKLLGRREDIPELLAQATIFCNASQWEGMSNAVLEAMAAGLPSVVVDAPGVSECHVDHETGFVVSRDANAIAQKLMLLLHDTALRARMGAEALVRVREKYSTKANRQKFIALYHELAQVA